MEKNISKSIVKWMNSLFQGHARKRMSSMSSNNLGHPDVTGSIYGIRVEIEVKQPGKTPTELQLSRLRMYRRQNCIAFWCDSLDGAKRQLRNEVRRWKPSAELSEFMNIE